MPPDRAFRRLWSNGRHQIRDHLLRLDRDDRLRRFGGHASDARIHTYCDDLDWGRALFIAYLVAGGVRGLGELTLLSNRARAAEAAVSVERPFQNRGLGTALLRRLVVAARNRMIERIHMICVLDNTRAVRLARRLDGRLRFSRGEAEARIEPAWPTCWTWLEEGRLALGGLTASAAGSSADGGSDIRAGP